MTFRPLALFASQKSTVELITFLTTRSFFLKFYLNSKFNLNRIIIIISSIWLLTGCASKTKNDTENAFRVCYGGLRDAATKIGEIRAKEQINVRAEVGGYIKTIYVKEGACVRKGDKLLSIDHSDIDREKQIAELNIQEAQILLNQAENDLSIACSLNAQKGISDESRNNSKNKCDLAKLNLQRNKLTLYKINNDLSKTTIRSPVNGILTDLLVKEGEPILVGAGNMSVSSILLSIADTSELLIYSNIGESDRLYSDIGKKVLIRLTSSGMTTTGAIVYCAPNAKKHSDEILSQFEMHIKIDSVLTGMFLGTNVEVELPIINVSHVLFVPKNYLKLEGKKAFVRQIDKQSGKSALREIVIGLTDYKNVEIKSGLNENDLILPVN
jgi:RND family efflux transporter MFP subunit